MIDFLTFVIALVIITTIVGFFGYLAWKMTISDPLIRDENTPVIDSSHEKRKKEKNTSEQGKKKRKEQKKPKRDVKDEDQVQQQQTQRNKPSQTSEETDDEREESEQDASTVPVQSVETSSKARKRNKNKTRSTTPPSSSTFSTEEKTKNPIATRAQPANPPKSTSKDELESTKQQQSKVQVQSAPNKKTTQPIQKQQQQQQEQPFIVVGGNRNKTATPPLQQNKSQVNTTSSVAPVQQSSTIQAQNEPLTQRQPLPQKEIPAAQSASTTNPLPIKQQQTQVPPKVADLIKVLPSSQAVVTELMSALDAFPLSADELDIIMHKIANKQSVVKQDWSKLQHGQKVDPQAHIGQVLDESAKAYEDDMKTNSMKRIKELTDELNNEKRRNNELVKEKLDHQREVQILHAQLDSVQIKPETSVPSQQKLQTLESQLKRITEENIHLNQQLTTAATSSPLPGGDASNMKVQVLSEQIKKLSVDNANLEKKVHSNELLVKEAQKEREDSIRYKEQLTQSVQKAEKALKEMEEKNHQQSNENRTLHLNEINEYKVRIQELEKDNEQLKREEIVHVEPTIATNIQTITLKDEEREQLEKEIDQLKGYIQSKEREYQDGKEKLTKEMEDYKKRIDNLQSERQSQENEIELLKQNKANEQRQLDESRSHEVNTVRAELNELKSKLSQSDEHLRRQHEKQRLILSDLLSDDLRNQLPNDNQDFDQWLSSYQQLSASHKRTLQEQSLALKNENGQLQRNMAEIENQLKEIEKTVQNKEESLLNELRQKETILDNIRNDNEHLNTELHRLRQEIQHLQSVSEARALKAQLDEKFLAAARTPSIVAADESFELVKQPSPSLSPIVIDIRAEQSSASTNDDSTVSSTSDQQS